MTAMVAGLVAPPLFLWASGIWTSQTPLGVVGYKAALIDQRRMRILLIDAIMPRQALGVRRLAKTD